LKYLIIVESPAKAKTIENFLSKDYKVVATKGHIRDLPDKRFGIKIEENGELTPQYIISRENGKKIKDVRDYAKKSEIIYLATDEDREGEAIAYHTAFALKKDPTKLPRIAFHEITKTAILKALKSPRKIDINLVNAQQTRRLLDRVVGYKLSPLLSSKVQRGLSAGRVQSSALKIIVERERSIRIFIPVEYWEIPTIFQKDINANLYSFKNEKLDRLSIKNETQANEIFESIKNDSFVIEKIEERDRVVVPLPPFMTSTLQQTASSKLGFSPKKTMSIAQALYEGVHISPRKKSGVITYMRTDSLNISKDAVSEARDFIKNSYGEKYIPDKPRVYTSKSKGAQEAHEAIRPTMMDFTLEQAKEFLNEDYYKVYKLIYNRFLASQSENAKFKTKSVHIKGNESSFRVSGRTLIFDGFYKFIQLDDKDKILPKELEVNKIMELQKLEKVQKFTEPPSRFSEAGLIKKLESLGIGRPSTYAPTISTLQSRGYIQLLKKKIEPKEIAFTVMGILETHFADIVDPDFTAQLEESLDDIADGKEDWQKLLQEFYTPFIKKVEEGKERIKSLKESIPTGEYCPECESELVHRRGKFGAFIACSGFPKCRYTLNSRGEKRKKVADRKSSEICGKCGKPMLIKNSINGDFLACSGYPKCRNTKPIVPPKIIEGIDCPLCGGKIIQKEFRKSEFYGCYNYPDCKFSSKYLPVNDVKCKKCGSHVVERTYRNKDIYECLNKDCKYREGKDGSDVPKRKTTKKSQKSSN
jgi:DNA topoisomerase-1